jgi:hypothetical protein
MARSDAGTRPDAGRFRRFATGPRSFRIQRKASSRKKPRPAARCCPRRCWRERTRQSDRDSLRIVDPIAPIRSDSAARRQNGTAGTRRCYARRSTFTRVGWTSSSRRTSVCASHHWEDRMRRLLLLLSLSLFAPWFPYLPAQAQPAPPGAYPPGAPPPAPYAQHPGPAPGGAATNTENCGTPDEPRPCPPLPRHPLPYYPANKQ